MQDVRDTTRSKITLRNKESKLRQFYEYWKTPGKNLEEQTDYWTAAANVDAKWAEDQIIAHFGFQKGRLEAGVISSADTVRKARDAIKHVCKAARIKLDWEYINDFLPKSEHGVGTKYRPFTLEEIRKILSYPDRRIRPIVLLMVSSGMSIGSFDRLTWGDIEPVRQNGEVICARVTLYRGKTRWNYPSFSSPECYAAMKEYIDYRSSHGEQISPDSPVLRDLFYPDSRAQAGSYAHLPRRLTVESVSDIVKKALRTAGLRPKKAPRGKGLDLGEDELAFYDALGVNDIAVRILGDATLRNIALKLTRMISRSVTIDWTQRESVQAEIRLKVKRILRKYNYPPDREAKATQTVL